MLPRAIVAAVVLAWPLGAAASDSPTTELTQQFDARVHPFLQAYCVTCHGKEKQEADLDLNGYASYDSVVANYGQWDLVLERLEAGEMPPDKAKKFPTDESRAEIVAWITAMRRHETQRNAGDPGPVLARRLSNAEYDYTIRDLTGADIRPTKEFPVDPANQAGFDNSGESLAMSPALLKKYLQAARTVSEHLVLKPDGFTFAPHPVVADTDRDKYAVLRIVDFYRRQPTDYADYFLAAWRHQHRVALGKPEATLSDTATAAKISAKYLATIWSTLTAAEDVGPIAKLQAMWRALPAPNAAQSDAARPGCAQMRDYVIGLREKIVPEVKNLNAARTGIQEGSQTLVLWKDRQMAANRRKYDPSALRVEEAVVADASKPATPAKTMAPKPAEANPAGVKLGGEFLAPAVVTTGTSATFRMAAAKKRGADADLVVPADPEQRARYEAAFARFAAVFPDAFFITERARVYLDAEKEQKLAGRLLSAGLHSMTGYFRDDGPLYDLVLDADGQREIDRLWREFDFLSAVPQRMHTSFVWFERTDSSYMRDPEFDPYRPEDKSVNTQEKVRQLAELYLAKARRNNASDAVQAAIREHFEIVAANLARVDRDRSDAEPVHRQALEDFAGLAWRRPLSPQERQQLREFYLTARADNGGDHEEAMRDCVTRILMSPNFSYRVDLGTTAAGKDNAAASGYQPLSDHALASRLSYFLWSSMPDAALRGRADRGELHDPAVLAGEARRMLRDPRIGNFAAEFAGNWLDFRRFEEHNAVDRERYPAFDAELRTAMFEEPIRFFSHVVARDRPILDLLYGDYTFVNTTLARHYGMTGVTPAPGEWVEVARAGEFGRGGLLPMAVFLTANSPGLRTSPVKRGYWVVRRILGERIPPPPPVVPNIPNDEKSLGELSLRDTLARHRTDKACAACHARFDSFGLVFEGYGAVGERRTIDFGGHPVETRADFPGGVSGDGLTGLRDYIHAHREKEFVDNLCRKLLAYALGRTLLPSDDTLIASMRSALAANDNHFGALVEAIVTSPQFLTKRSPATNAATTASASR